MNSISHKCSEPIYPSGFNELYAARPLPPIPPTSTLDQQLKFDTDKIAGSSEQQSHRSLTGKYKFSFFLQTFSKTESHFPLCQSILESKHKLHLRLPTAFISLLESCSLKKGAEKIFNLHLNFQLHI